MRAEAMKTVWKYELELNQEQEVMVPNGTHALTARFNDNGKLYLWAIETNDDETVGMPVFIHRTGRRVLKGAAYGRYLATVRMTGFAPEFHVFVGAGF
jgi:hypothetical protein